MATRSPSTGHVPHVLPILEKPITFKGYVVGIENRIRLGDKAFTLLTEHLALMIIAGRRGLDPVNQKERKHPFDGALSKELSPFRLKERLECASPFCKHYMGGLNHSSQHNNITDELWEIHYQHSRLRPQPEMTDEWIRKSNAQQIKEAMVHISRFRTDEKLDGQQPKNIESVAVQNAIGRDGGVCVVTGAKQCDVFWFIPPTWNNNVTNNNITGEHEGGSRLVTGINILEDEICSATKLRTTHEAWNFICVSKELYAYLTLGLCAFKYVQQQKVDAEEEVEVELQFYWMPRLTPRFNEIASDALVEEINTIHRAGYPPPQRYLHDWEAKFKHRGDRKAISGDTIKIKVPKGDAKRLESVVKVHWGCVLFTSLCGGAGCPAFLTGMKLQDRSIQPTRVPMEEVLNIVEAQRLEAGVDKMGSDGGFLPSVPSENLISGVSCGTPGSSSAGRSSRKEESESTTSSWAK
ncbi:hypothetical protein FLONG3_10462 [Fusarium longipes]|uniref:Uncharacterized protein n=1 Tax=Fusarium longipes TaxID=694270 RepID=A0A395RNC8_9HYPO|nr:hypothetical protein FLONG3_10462 [Fusarium longipes]